MRRAAVIVMSLVAIFAVTIAIFQYRSIRQHRENVRISRAVAAGLTVQFMTDPRFRNVHVPGYVGTAGLFRADGIFRVTGSVPSQKDLQQLAEIVRAMNPPGKLVLQVAVPQPSIPKRK